MKIAIITIHAMHNPGSVFQAYALQRFLSDSHDVDIIDYRPSYFYSEHSGIKLLAKKILFHKDYKSRDRKFSDFISENLKLTRRFSEYSELEKTEFDYDVYMTGSDQLWNTDFPCGNDKAFFLKFVEGKKISYSTSVGKKIIDEKNRLALKENLTDFSHLSVREKKTAEDLAQLLERSVSWVCDPVLLLTSDKYSQFIEKKPLINEPYAMVYLSPESEILDQIVEHYSKKGLKIVLVGGFTKRCKCDYHIKDVGPVEFLNMIYHSNVVISKSFHATAFCHIFHKDFVTLVPPHNGERITSLLQLSGLENKAVYDVFDQEKIDDVIDWNDVDDKISDHIKSSVDYLINAIEK